MNRHPLLPLALFGLVSILPTIAAHAQDDLETRVERARAREAESRPAERGATLAVRVLGVSNPLFAGVDDAAIPAVLIDPTGVTANVPASLAIQVWGAAFDVATNTIYLSSGTGFHSWVVGAGTVTTIGTFTSSVDAVALVMEGIAVSKGTLYGSRVANTANNPEGIYSIDKATGVSTLVSAFAVTANQTLSGLDADPVTGTLYGTNDVSNVSLRGLVEIPLDGTVVQITDYPAGETDIDGLAIGTDGRAYLVEDDSTAASGGIHVYDFVGDTYLAPIPTPWPTSEVFSAGAWVYESTPVPPGCSAPEVAIPDNLPAGVSDTVTMADGPEFITDLNLGLATSHTWVGDLVFTLTHVDTGTSVVVIHRPGVPTTPFGCNGDDIDVVVDDEGSDPAIESQCTDLPAIEGEAPGGDPAGAVLDAFDGELAAGDWTLSVVDSATGDEGTLEGWCLLPTLDTMPFLDGFESEDTSRWSSTVL